MADAAGFVGRKTELAKLTALTRLKVASLVVIKGRRRVGKSRLVTEFAARLPGYRSVVLTGLAPDEKTSPQTEREDFARQLSKALVIPPVQADDWDTLLWALVGKLKSAWDLHFSRNCSLILILSGSLTRKPRNFTFRPVLIHVNGVEESVEEQRYFDAVIDFAELWH